MKKKLIHSCLLSLSVFACSIPNQEIKKDKLNIKSNLSKKDKKFKTKSLSIVHHPNRVAELNEEAYYYAHNDIKYYVDLRAQYIQNGQTPEPWWPESGTTHYSGTARDNEYQTRIRTPEYFTALKCINDGFHEQSYRDAWPDIQNAITNNIIPSAYHHYKYYGINESYRLTSAPYFNALKANKVFREEAYFNANESTHSTIKYALDNNFTTANFVNGYEHYILNKTPTFNPLDNPYYQTALDDHIAGYWEDSYLYSYPDILLAVDGNQSTPPILPTGYSHYNPYGRTEGRLSSAVYQESVNNVDIHSGQSKTIDFSTNSNQVKIFRFNVLPNRKYRFILNEMSEEDGYLIIKDQNNNIVVQDDDTYGLDSFVKFDSGNSIARYTVEATTSNNGSPSTSPQGKFILTMFHAFKN